MFFKTTTGKVTGKTPTIENPQARCECGCTKQAHFHAPTSAGKVDAGRCVNHPECSVFRPAT